MATHAQNIENLRNAVYGEQVRGSMIELFEEDHTLVKNGISVGTEVTSASSPTTGYTEGNVYINSETLDVYKLIGTAWTKVGNLKGIASITTEQSTEDGGISTITITTTDGTPSTFTVKNGETGAKGDKGDKGNPGEPAGFATPTATVTGSTGIPEVVVTASGADTAKQFNFEFRNIKGEKGAKGEPGNTGKGVLSITGKKNGKVTTFTANFTDGTSQVIGTVTDGSDGTGQGDMKYETYDPTQSGTVNYARGISNGTDSIDDAYNYVIEKADKATTLAGYEIEDAYTKNETDEAISDAITELKYSVKGGVGKVITQIQQTNGVISAEEADFDIEAINSKASAIPSTDYLTDSKTYHTNDLFIYNNRGYKVINADSGIGGSTIKSDMSTYAEETTIGNEVGKLNNNLSNKLTAVTGGIGGATDLNTLMETGFYTANGATSINKPSDLSSIKGGLIVIKSASDRILQIIVSDENILYARLYTGTWGEWNKNNKLKKKSVSKAFSTSNQTFADADLYNRDYVDVYITCSTTSELNRMVRVYRDTNVGFTVSYGASDYRLNVKLSFSNNSSSQGVVTFGCVSGQCVGWNANIITLSTVYYN